MKSIKKTFQYRRCYIRDTHIKSEINMLSPIPLLVIRLIQCLILMTIVIQTVQLICFKSLIHEKMWYVTIECVSVPSYGSDGS